ncbi:MAG: hypothetical protein LAO05_11470 [Acidobacteriia bacterium]|nr:hypothetical protein [Terriglobia bacterium]
MQYRAFEPGIEVNGQTVNSIVDGFRFLREFPSRILLEEGIGKPAAQGLVEIDPEAWYSQEAWLRAFERVGKEMGRPNLFAIGLRIPENAKFPPTITNIHDAIASIDVAYHMNHRKHGHVMYDPLKATMLEGIGHYGYEPVAGKAMIVSRCRNPYPCDFDRGILTAMARRFEKAALVTHVDAEPCRERGGESCTYHVGW